MPIKFCCLAAIAVLAPAALLAGSISACPADTLVPYLENACQDSFGAVFYSFSFSSSQPGMPTIAASQIQVSPFESGSQFGLRFDLGGLMAQTGLAAPTLDFTVTSPSGITSASVLTSQAVPSAQTTVSFCDADDGPCSGANQVMLSSTTGDAATAQLPFGDAGQGEKTISVHSVLNPGRDESFSIVFGTASADPQPSSVPEPVPLALAGGGLIALGLVARKRKR